MIRKILIICVLLFFACANSHKPKLTNIDILEFYDDLDSNDIIILDVRTSHERASGYINNSTHIDYYDDLFLEKVNLLNKETPIYIYCKIGGRSIKVAKKISELGFKNIYNLEGGFLKWSTNNLPFEFESEMKLDNLSQKYSKAHIDSLISLNNNTLIYISTKWCAPCREMNPIVESLEDEFYDHLKIINIDLDNNNFIKEMYKISTIPLFVLYRNDKEIWRKNGIIAFSDVADKL